MTYALRTSRGLQGGKEKEECFGQPQVYDINTEVQKGMVYLKNCGSWLNMSRVAVCLS